MLRIVRVSLFFLTLVAVFLLLFPARAVAGEARSIWIWGSTVRSVGAEVVAADLEQRGITDAILLVKGTAGTVAYPSAIAPPAAPVDTLGPFLAACHARRIKVHAWLMYNQDDYFGITRTARKYAIWHVGTASAPLPYSMNDGRICPLRAKEEYNPYFLSIVDEILRLYPVDGIHLDAIRYGHAVYCFCQAHRDLAAAQGINMSRVNDLIQKTFYTPADQQTYFNAFAAGDADATRWVGLRVSEINGVVQAVREAINRYNAANQTAIALSAALMPEGALPDMVTSGARSDQFALCHYAQSYSEMSPMLSFLAPMAYHKDYGKPPAWVGNVVAGAIAQAGSTPVLAGIQTYNVTSSEIADALFAARWNGAGGFALFRHGVSAAADRAWEAVVPTLETLMADTQAALDAGWIDNAGIHRSLLQKLKNAAKSDPTAARNQIQAYLQEVAAQSGKHIAWGAARNLTANAQWVLDLMP